MEVNTPNAALLTFAPLSDGTECYELDAGSQTDMFACPTTGQLFTGATMVLEVEQRSSRSAKQLFCPCCEKSALRIGSKGSETLMVCGTCGWDARQSGVSSVAELLERDGDPFPDVSRTFKELQRQLAANGEGGELGSKGGSIGERDGLGIVRTMSQKRVREREAAESGDADNEDGSKQSFTELQAAKERRILQSESEDEAASLRITEDEEQIAKLMGDVVVEEMTRREERVVTGFWWRKDGVARRRVRHPRVIIKSPYSGDVVWINGGKGTDGLCDWNAARFLPQFEVEVSQSAVGGTKAHVKVCNILPYAIAVYIWKGGESIGDVDEIAVAGSVELKGRGDGYVEVSDISCGQSSSVWTKPTWDRVVALDVKVRISTEEVDDMCGLPGEVVQTLRRHVWTFRMFARHASERSQ